MVRLLVRSLVALVVVGTTTLTSAAAAEVVCSARVSPGDLAVGIDLITDATCQNGGLGCLGTTCRFCKRRSTPASDHLASCPSTPAPAPAPAPAPVSTASGECDALLSPGDRAVGILTTRDPSCTNGGVGCISASCRYCRAQSTPQSQHLMACSSFAGPAPATTQPAPPPATPSTTTSSSGVCASMISSGDRDVGISITNDASCARGGVGCIGGSTCRYCRVLETPQSKHLQLCSAIITQSTTPLVLEAQVQSDGGGPPASNGSSGSGVVHSILSIGGVTIGVVLAAVAAKRIRRDRSTDDALVTPTNIVHRNEPLCTL